MAMLPGHNRQGFEDFWEGDVAGQPFRLFEAHLVQRTNDSKGRSRSTTKFRGPFLSIGCAEPFHGTTIVQRPAASVLPQRRRRSSPAVRRPSTAKARVTATRCSTRAPASA